MKSTWPARADSIAAPAGITSPGPKDCCKGCRIQDKNCAWIKRDCAQVRKKQIVFCFECKDFPCGNLKKLADRHLRDDQISLLDNLLRIRKIGAEKWLKEQEAEWRCPECEGNVCVMDRKCYDCGYEID